MNRDPFFNPHTNIDFTPEDPERGLAIGVSRGGMPPSADAADARSGLTVNIDPYHDQLGRFTTGPGLGGRHTTSSELGARRMFYTEVTEFPSTAPTSPFGTPAKTPSPASTPTPNPNEPYPTPASTPSATPASTPVGTTASTPSPTPASAPSATPAGTPPDTGKSAIKIVLSSVLLDTDRHYTKKAIPGAIILTHYGPGTKAGGWDPVHDSNSDIGKGNHENKLTPLSLSISRDLARHYRLKLGGPVYLNGSYIGNYDDTAPEDGRVDIYDHDNIAGTRWGGVLKGGKLSSKSPKK
jgi:hypothetical protein